jgi:ATP-dependent RNA helicase DDX19/DBP5
MANTRELIRQI